MFTGLFFFFEFLTPFIFGDRNFLICTLFWMIVSVSDAPRGEIQVLYSVLDDC
jgi:hypothetical protein